MTLLPEEGTVASIESVDDALSAWSFRGTVESKRPRWTDYEDALESGSLKSSSYVLGDEKLPLLR